MRTLVLFIIQQVLQFQLLILIECNNSTNPYSCNTGIGLIYGATSPSGHIRIEEGNTLEVNCTIDLSHKKIGGLNASYLHFKLSNNKIGIANDLIETTVLSPSTARLRIHKINASTPIVSCYLRDEKIGDKIVCMNHVDVGSKPLEVIDLKCRETDWGTPSEKFICSWKKPHNNIETNYSISFSHGGRYKISCPTASLINSNNLTYYCEWKKQNGHSYPSNMDRINIIIDGTNALANKSWTNYSFNHWEIVTPSGPSSVVAKSLSDSQVQVSWSIPNFFEHFVPGLTHRLTLCPNISTEHKINCVVQDFTSKRETSLSQIIQVPFPYVEYIVKLRIKSQVAQDEEEFWSKSISDKAQTHPKKPVSPPAVGKGSFIIENKFKVRDVLIYWLPLASYLKNGSNFHYKLKLYKGDSFISERDVGEDEKFVKLANLSWNSYRVKLSSVNSEGESEENSVLVIPSDTQGPKPPEAVSKLDYRNGSYEISWTPPENDENIVSYAIYRCNGSSWDRCDSLVEWREVDKWKREFLFENLNSSLLHVFGVSANGVESSSSMVITTCELIHQNVPKKPRKLVSVSVSEDKIKIKWHLGCTYKPGFVEKYKITYYILRHKNDTCSEVSDVRKSEEIVGGESNEFDLLNLKADSSYCIWVSFITEGGESQPSDPLRVSTSETAPNEPPTVQVLETTNTTSIITIRPPTQSNGKISKFFIIIHSLDESSSSTKTIELRVDETQIFSNVEFNYNLTDLEPNMNYSFKISACTRPISCSQDSDPVLFQTKKGATKIKSEPVLYYENGQILVSWAQPSHLGGPINSFELRLRKNGILLDDEDPIKIPFDLERQSYSEAVHLKCESNTNITAELRAVSISADENEIYGAWSPEGSLNCYGTETWFIWILIVFSILILCFIVAFITLKCWSKIQKMGDFSVVLPPGIDVLQLNGFSSSSPKESEKEIDETDLEIDRGILSYDEQPPSKDYHHLSHSPKESEEGGGGGGGGGGSLWLWHHRTKNGSQENIIKNHHPNYPPSSEHVPQLPPLTADLLERVSSHGLSSSSSGSGGEEESSFPHFLSPPNNNYSNSPIIPPPNVGGGGVNNIGEFNNIGGGVNNLGGGGGGVNNLGGGGGGGDIFTPPSSAYVKWTALRTDPLLNETTANKTPYCQVGILLD